MKVPEFDHPTRGRAYSHANTELPDVRAIEVQAMADLIELRWAGDIVEFGAGNGLLTERILARLAREGAGEAAGGRLVAIDNSEFVCQLLRERFANIDVRLLGTDEKLPVMSGSCTTIASLANFHHVADKAAMLGEFARALKPRGKVVIGDIERGTPAARYFDEVIDKICSTGHRHEFLDEERYRDLCKGAGLEPETWQPRSVPWCFRPSGDQTAREVAGWFLKRIHDAQCSEAECFDYASQYLGFRQSGDTLQMNWTLTYATASRPLDC